MIRKGVMDRFYQTRKRSISLRREQCKTKTVKPSAGGNKRKLAEALITTNETQPSKHLKKVHHRVLKVSVATVENINCVKAKDNTTLNLLSQEKLTVPHRRAWEKAIPTAPTDDLVEKRNRRLRKRLRSGTRLAIAPREKNAKMTTTIDKSTNETQILSPKLVALRTSKMDDPKMPKLPSSHYRLLRTFVALETALNIAIVRRPASAHFQGLKAQVESSSHTNFTKKDLACILSLFPKAYKLSYEAAESVERKHASGSVGSTTSSTRKESKLWIRFGEGAMPDSRSNKEQSGRTSSYLKEALLQDRLRIFKMKLVERVKECHREWLKHNDTSISEAELEELPGDYHYKFEAEIDRLVAQIPPAALPEDPALLKREEGEGGAAQKMLAMIRKPKAEPSQSALEREKEMLRKNGLPEGLEGIDLNLVAKVRLRDSKKRADKALGGPQIRENLRDIEMLPYLVDLIRTILRARNRRAMATKELIPLLVKSHKNRECPPTTEMVARQIRMLAKASPGFCVLKTYPNREILRVNLKYAVVRARLEIGKVKQKEKKKLSDIEDQLCKTY
eukprot:jgi/Bigna1/71113/fgenesh1_pg.14_\